ncbi:MAG: hypothetical protein J6R18_03370 [Kiritimatiellae bacterium]|nr:hypothetical protein [Kiritimatiellia bacterium]
MICLKTIFLIPVLTVGTAAALHATAYIHGDERKYLPRFWLFFTATLASMAAVVLADGKLPFLLAWEAMGLASAGLVAFESKEKHVRKAAWIYLLACHAGACALMLAGVLHENPATVTAAFFCAIAGFGLKIGFPFFHAWLPEAHPAAPAPASAVMSGAMIPLGFYGILKYFPLTGGNTPYLQLIGWTLLILGISGAVGGILFALPQANLKRLLAYSSVENMGIISIGLGLGAISASTQAYSQVGKLCIAGALVHMLNHAFLKGALFLAAGSVVRQTGTLNQDKLGGLMRKMPFTGTLFTINAMGLSGLPPLNGFLGELAIYIGAFHLIKSASPVLIAAGFLAMLSLAIIGGMAVAAYAKSVGTVFLGSPRSQEAEKAEETPKRMWIAQLILTILSLAMIPFSIFIINGMAGGFATDCLVYAAVAGIGLTALTAALVFLRNHICARGNAKTISEVWDCGYENPASRMAYTATAFTQPIADLFHPLLRSRRHVIPFKDSPSDPSDAAIATETDDIAIKGFWRPAFTYVARIFQMIHLLQNGSLHFYILIIILAMLALLVSALVS